CLVLRPQYSDGERAHCGMAHRSRWQDRAHPSVFRRPSVRPRLILCSCSTAAIGGESRLNAALHVRTYYALDVRATPPLPTRVPPLLRQPLPSEVFSSAVIARHPTPAALT